MHPWLSMTKKRAHLPHNITLQLKNTDEKHSDQLSALMNNYWGQASNSKGRKDLERNSNPHLPKIRATSAVVPEELSRV